MLLIILHVILKGSCVRITTVLVTISLEKIPGDCILRGIVLKLRLRQDIKQLLRYLTSPQ